MRNKFLLVLAFILTFTSLSFANPQPVLADGLNDLGYPFAQGQTWYVYEGYNAGSHTGSLAYAFDLVTGNASNVNTGAETIYAPIGGTVNNNIRLCGNGANNAYHTWVYPNTSCPSGDTDWGQQINITFSGGTISLQHINPTVTSGNVTKGDPIGTVFQGHPGGVNHLHMQLLGTYLTYGVWNFPGRNPMAGENGAYSGTAISYPVPVPPAPTIYPNVTIAKLTCSNPGKLLETYVGTDHLVYVRLWDTATNQAVGPWQMRTGGGLGGVTTFEYNCIVYQFIRGMDNNVWKRTSTDGAATWSNWTYDNQSAIGDVTYAVYKDNIYLAVRGSNSWVYNKIITVNSEGAWFNNTGGTASDINMIVSFGRMELWQALRGYGDNRVWMRTLNFNDTWDSWQLNSGATKSNVTMTEYLGNIYQSVIGVDDKVWTRVYQAGSWGAWQTDGKSGIGNVTMQVFNGILFQAVRGSDNLVYWRITTTQDNSWWSGWQMNGGGTYSDVTMFAWNDKLYQLVSGADGSGGWQRTFDGTTWSSWTH